MDEQASENVRLLRGGILVIKSFAALCTVSLGSLPCVCVCGGGNVCMCAQVCACAFVNTMNACISKRLYTPWALLLLLLCAHIGTR